MCACSARYNLPEKGGEDEGEDEYKGESESEETKGKGGVEVEGVG